MSPNSLSFSLSWLVAVGRTLVCAGLTMSAQVLPPPVLKPVVPAELFVREFRFIGNSAFSNFELARVTAPFTNRKITSTELEEARRAVTLYYISRGYVNSGAVIPDQDPTDGVVTLKIVEGSISRVDVHENNWLRTDYIRSRIMRWGNPPVNLNELKDGLQILRQNPNLTQINAELLPGAAPGQGILDVRVVDQQPFRLGLEIDNHRPPSVGAEEVSIRAADLNLTGHSDALELRYGLVNRGTDHGWEFSGVENLGGAYTLPLNRYDTTIGVHGSRLNTSIVEEPFTRLGIESVTVGYGAQLRHPIYQTPNSELALSIGFDRRQNDTTLLGIPFNISPGAVNGRMITSVIKLSQEWINRGQNYVLALRSTFNIGIDELNATDDQILGNPDGESLSWVGQAQYLRRLFDTQNQLVLRLSGQWAGERLLALEQMSVGGADTVRGYRENQLVRDRAVVGSVEFRAPVLFNKAGAGILYVAPFFDFGRAWNVGGSPDPTNLSSVGVGLLLTLNKYLNAELYWGYRLRHISSPHSDAQDLGLHFRVNVAAF